MANDRKWKFLVPVAAAAAALVGGTLQVAEGATTKDATQSKDNLVLVPAAPAANTPLMGHSSHSSHSSHGSSR